MLELGKDSVFEHNEILGDIADSGIEDVILIGPVFCSVANELKNKCFKDSEGAAGFIKNNSISGKTILLKASRGIHLESIVKDL